MLVIDNFLSKYYFCGFSNDVEREGSNSSMRIHLLYFILDPHFFTLLCQGESWIQGYYSG